MGAGRVDVGHIGFPDPTAIAMINYPNRDRNGLTTRVMEVDINVMPNIVASPTTSDEPDLSDRPRLLLVEDDDELRAGLRRQLGNDFHVTALSDGANAAVLLTNTDYDVILADIGLPRLSGVDILRLARSRDMDVPVILMTARPSSDTLREALELGAFTYLHKPLAADLVRLTLLHAAKISKIARLRREARAEKVGIELLGERESLMSTFNRALESLVVHHQPIVSSASQRTIGYEVLMRPQEPSVPHPGAMLELAERVGRIDELGRRVRRLAAQSHVRGSVGASLLFVNLHPAELADPELFDESSPLGSIASNVVLEITERSALSDVAETRRRTQELRRIGYQIAIDDLGAGYAGLSWFAALEPQIVKLDMSLIRDIDTSPVRSRIVRRITGLCHELAMQVVAEGVETERELQSAIDLGCDLLQGYHLGKPRREMTPSLTTW